MHTQPSYRPHITHSKTASLLLDGKSYTLEQAYVTAVQEMHAKHYAEAEKLYRAILDKATAHAPSLNGLGVIAFRRGDVNKSIHFYQRAIFSNPNHLEAYNNLAYALMSKGQMEDAETFLRQVLSLKPDYVGALYNLTLLRKFRSADDADIQHIQHVLEKASSHNLSAKNNIAFLHFALGKAYDDCGQFQTAFSHFEKANQWSDQRVNFNSAAFSRYVSRIIGFCDKSFLASNTLCGSATERPIFVVGMPRSGTTLLASLLSNHPAIAMGGEPTFIQESCAKLSALVGGNVPAYPEAIQHLTPEVVVSLAQEYRHHLLSLNISQRLYTVDKHPLNFLHLGFIQILFPKAHIIHCIRNPMDTCLSNYFQCFADDHGYSFNLEKIGHFYNDHTRLMAHWKEVLSLPIQQVHYEDVVHNTREALLPIFQSLNLEMDERCLKTENGNHIIKTASLWQARQPIYQQSIARWKHYEEFLTPLKSLIQGA